MRLGDLVAADGLRLRLVAGEDRLDSAVRWVHTTELIDPSPYLSGGELVLTNALWHRPGSGALEFVRRLAGSGAVGLVVGAVPSRETTPPDIVEAAREVGLPLVEAPADLSFSAISAMVAEHYSAERRMPLIRALDRSQALAGALTSGGGIRDVLRILERELGIASSLYAADGELLASTGTPLTRADALAIARVAPKPGGQHFELETGQPVAVFSVEGFGRPSSHLVIEHRLDELLPEAQAAVDQVLMFVTLELLRQEAVRATEMNFAAELFDLLPAGESRTLEVEARLQSFGLDPSTSLVTLLAGARVPPSRAELNRMRAAAIGLLRKDGIAHIAVMRDDELGMIMSWPGTSRELTGFARGLHDAMADACRSEVRGLAIGVGSLSDGVGALRRSLQEAQSALLEAFRTGVTVTTQSDAGSFAVLLALHDPPTHASYRNAVLGQLEDYDRRRRTQLVSTLRVFLKNNGAHKATAEELHIHSNTLRYRLRRVETLTGRDLSVMDERVNFHIALSLSGE